MKLMSNLENKFLFRTCKNGVLVNILLCKMTNSSVHVLRRYRNTTA